ncbi:MAG: hypothetical protein ACO29U_08995 [Crocinitomicaceae bacterium]|jgi:hypothetical protein
MENEKSGMKPWVANLIVFGLEVCEILIYFALAGRAFRDAMKGDISGAFNDVIGAMWFLNISALAIAFAVFFIKPLRTKLNLGIAWWNIIWVAGNLYMMYS